MINFTNELLTAIKTKDETQAIFYLECISGFDINGISDESGNSLLHLAIQNNMPKLFDEVLKRHVDISKTNRDGKTSFDSAFELGKEDFVNKLLEAPKPKTAMVYAAARPATERTEELKVTAAAAKEAEKRAEHGQAERKAREDGKEREEREERKERKDLEEKKEREEKKNRVEEGTAKQGILFSAKEMASAESARPISMPTPLIAVNKILAGMGETHIDECECQPPLARSTGKHSLRDELDSMTSVQTARQYPVSQYGQPIVLMILGSGKLKQTATMAASLMKSGRDVELVLIDHEIELDHLAHKEFDEVLKQLQTVYDRKASVIGRFSSFEVYKSIMERKGAPVVTRYGIPLKTSAKEYAEFTKRTGKELLISEEDKERNRAYAEEYEKYREQARKVPHVVAVIDDITTLGGAYGPISSYPEFGSDWGQLKEYRKLVYREDIVKELGRIANKNPDSGVDKLLFITTEKLSSSYNDEIRITAAATLVKARDYKPGEAHLGEKIPAGQLEQTVLAEVTKEASKEERLALKKLKEKMKTEKGAKKTAKPN